MKKKKTQDKSLSRKNASGTQTTSQPQKESVPRELNKLTSDSGLTADQIVELKTKIKERKRHTGHDRVEDGDSLFENNRNEKVVKDIIQRERLLVGTHNHLQAQQPFDDCLRVVQAMMAKELKEKEQEKKAGILPAAHVVHNRYEKVNETDFWKENLKSGATTDWQLDTRGSFEGLDVSKIVAASKQPIRRETVPANINEIPNPTPRAITSAESNDSRKRPRPESRDVSIEVEPPRPVLGHPIIIVPGKSLPNALLTLSNAKQFLSDYQFINPFDLKDKSIKSEKVEFDYKPKSGQILKIIVIDNVSSLRWKDWNNVIAVFAQGQEWQFKQYPKEWGGVAGIFSRAKGFYMYYDDEKIPTSVNTWNVKCLSVNRHKRHFDSTAAKKIWDELDLELRKRNYIK